MIRRAVIVVVLVLFPIAAAAQSNEIGLFVSTTQFDESEIRDGADIFDVRFDEQMGYGVLYNRFWTSGFSTEFGYQKLGADLTLSFGTIRENAGDLDLDVLSATGQFHFLRNGIVSPYIGAGAAYVSGEAGSIDVDELERVDLESEVDLLVNAGINFRIGGGTAIFIDGKYIAYSARGEGDPGDESLDVNPLIIAAGVKFRF